MQDQIYDAVVLSKCLWTGWRLLCFVMLTATAVLSPPETAIGCSSFISSEPASMFGEYDGFGEPEGEGRQFHNPQGPRNLRVREIICHYLFYTVVWLHTLIDRYVCALKQCIAHVVWL